MAEHKYQQQDHRAGLQHLAHLQQEASVVPAVLVHQRQHLQQGSETHHWEGTAQVALAEAALEAHLQQHRLQQL